MLNALYPESSTQINGKIYVICGSTTYEGSISVTAVYDVATNKWTNKASMPFVKHGASVTIDDKIYFIGDSYEDGAFVALLQIYDPSADTWSQGARPPQGGVSQKSAFTPTGEMSPKRIYIVDGNLRIYDPTKNEWTLGPNRTTTSFFMGVALLKDRLYSIGGLTDERSGFISAQMPIITKYATNEEYTPIGYGTPDSSYVPPVESSPPRLSVLSCLLYTSDAADE